MTVPLGSTPITHSAQVVAVYTVLKTGAPVGRITTVLEGAYVTIDTTAETLRSITFNCLDPTRILAPEATGGGELQPTGVEVQVQMGFQFGTTAPVLWTQGIFGVSTVDNSTSAATIDSGGGDYPGPGPNLTVTGYDRSRRIALSLFTAPFTIAANTPVAEAIDEILASQAPWCTNPNIAPTTYEVAQQVLAVGTDPWQAIVAIAAAAGMVAYFDAQGILVVRPTPTTAGSPTALSIIDGPTQIAMSCTTVNSDTPGYNGVSVVSSSAGAETGYSGIAWTTDPTSPLYYLGPFGARPAPPVTVSTATSDDQCAAIASALLSQYLGLSRSIIADIIPCPFLDAYDLVFVRNAKTTVTGVYILQQSTRYLSYTEQETITVVPLGTPLSQLSWLQNPSAALFGSISPFYTGAGTYTTTFDETGTTTGTAYSSNSSGSFFGHTAELDDVGFITVAGFSAIWGGSLLWRVLRDPFSSGGDEDVEDDIGDGLEDL